MNALTFTRLACNIVVVIGAIAVFALGMRGSGIQPVHLLTLGAIALFGGAIQFAVSIFRPQAIKPAWDEQTVASHRASYQFGYWAALLGFWVFLALGASGGFLWIGVVLICAPSIWMVVASLMGRAG